jgi:hypothetical protein
MYTDVPNSKGLQGPVTMMGKVRFCFIKSLQ